MLKENNIFINGRFLTQNITGVQRFASEICLKLKEIFPGIRIISPKNIINKNIAEILEPEIRGTLSGHLWEQFELPLFLKKEKNALLINLCNTAPLNYPNQIVTIHDLSFKINPNWFSKSFYLYYNFLIPKIAQKSKRIVTVSQSSKNDLIEIFNIDQNKIFVIPNSISKDFCNSFSADLSEELSLPEKFILAVSSIDPRKNLKNLIQAYKKVQEKHGLQLVIVGSPNNVFANSDLKDLVYNDKSIIFTGYINDNLLKMCYKRALAFLYPSLYEGFGIPPLEAMAMGCPTVVSNIASLPEICGDASHYVNPYNSEDIAEGINFVLENDNYRETLIKKGFERIKRFDWSSSARKLVDVIKMVHS